MENKDFSTSDMEVNEGAAQGTVNVQPQSAGMIEKNCPRCGSIIAQNQTGCPTCGFVFAEAQTAPQQEVSQAASQQETANEAINNFNMQLEKKNKKKKVVPVVAAVIGVVVIAFGALFFALNSKAQAVISAIQREDLDSTAVEAVYSQLTPIGEMLFSGKIQDAFVARVKSTPYVASENNIPVNPSSMLDYIEFDDIAEIIGVTSATHPSVMAYIDAVLELNAYIDYNNLYFCVYLSFDGYSNAISLLAESFNNVDEAYAYVKEGYTKAKEYNKNEMTEAYMQVYYDVYMELYDWSVYGYRFYGSHKTDVSVITDAYDTFKIYMAKIDTARSEVDALVAAFPVIE